MSLGYSRFMGNVFVMMLFSWILSVDEVITERPIAEVIYVANYKIYNKESTDIYSLNQDKKELEKETCCSCKVI